LAQKESTTAIEQAAADPDAGMIENVLLHGDLSKLTNAQRVSYYQKVCESVGLNPLTKPFDFMYLRKRDDDGAWGRILVLYAKATAANQLRSIHGVSISDISVDETNTHFIVKVKGVDKTGRSDMEVGVVKKSDMQGDFGNAYMKAVTKAKRRLTLSLCGLGMLDETEVTSIPDAAVVEVTETGEVTNPDPVTQRAWDEWLKLCERADAVKVPHADPAREQTTMGDLKQAYRELRSFVEQAEDQAQNTG
jgi:hypothetical protein